MLRPLLIVLGVAMVVIAIAWRARDLRRRSGGVEAALRSGDPLTRARALREIASVGLRPWAAMLLARTREVGDGPEADELVWLIGACQWEPADEPAIVQLRLWAARRLERAPVDATPEVTVTEVDVTEEELTEEDEHREDPPHETIPSDGPPAGSRPEIVDEIEAIVGSSVLALSFVPMAPGGS